MKDIVNRIIQQLDKIDDKVGSIDKTMVKQEENLKEHMRRTNILEDQHNLLYKQFEKELKPLKIHVNQVKVITKALIIIAPIIATILGLVYNYR